MSIRNFVSSAFASKDLQGLNDAQLSAIVTVLVLAAHADDNVTEDEKRELEAGLRELPWSGADARKGVRAAIDTASALAASLPTLEGRLEKLKEIGAELPSDAARERAYRMAILVNSADGEVNEAERAFLTGMATSLGIDAGKAQGIFYAVKHQAGVYE